MPARVISRVTWRLIPFMFLLYIVAYLDRINLGFAAGQMKVALDMNDEVIGRVASIFFAGYFFFQIPSNLMLERVGARRWIGVLMIAWGVVSACGAWARTATTFYILRFLLGVTEAGFFPGMILYLTYWFPQRERARAVSSFMTAIPCAGVLGGLVSGVLLSHPGLGFQGWQWLYLCEAMPAIVLGFVTFIFLDNCPAEATWLSPDERAWLVAELDAERARKATDHRPRLIDALLDVRVWLLSALYLMLNTDMYAVSVWLPQMISSYGGLSETTIGVLSAIPYVLAAVGMVWLGAHSDRSGNHRGYVAMSALISAAGFGIGMIAPNPAVMVAGFSLAAFGLWGTVGPFWALPTSFLGGTAAASGIALINALGTAGGSIGTYAVGALRQHSTSFLAALACMGVVMLGAALLTRLIRPPR